MIIPLSFEREMEPISYLATLIADVKTTSEALDEALHDLRKGKPHEDVKWCLMAVGERLAYVQQGIQDLLKEL